jgi:hypothetical protein
MWKFAGHVQRNRVLSPSTLYPRGTQTHIPKVVFQLSPPELTVLDTSEEAAAVELLAELLLEAARGRAPVPSAGPALIDEAEEED